MKPISTSTKKPIYKIRVNGLDCTNAGQPENHNVIYNLWQDQIQTVEIELLNKDPSDTKVVDNKIVEDLLVILEAIKIDSIDLTDKFSKISVYKDQQGNVHRTHGYLTFNGCLTIKIHHNLLWTMWMLGVI